MSRFSPRGAVGFGLGSLVALSIIGGAALYDRRLIDSGIVWTVALVLDGMVGGGIAGRKLIGAFGFGLGFLALGLLPLVLLAIQGMGEGGGFLFLLAVFAVPYAIAGAVGAAFLDMAMEGAKAFGIGGLAGVVPAAMLLQGTSGGGTSARVAVVLALLLAFVLPQVVGGGLFGKSYEEEMAARKSGLSLSR